MRLAIAAFVLAATPTGSSGPVAVHRADIVPQVLIVGGGPDKAHNQVAIESNVRYLARLLPQGSTFKVLFANGNPEDPNVQFEDDEHRERYRKPKLPRQDGPADLSHVRQEIRALGDGLRDHEGAPAVLYFTGHGSPDEESSFENNMFDLWREDALTVKDLSTALRSIPSTSPISLIMVECYSGAFANVLFENGSPTGHEVSRPICGFFASVAQRMAAGCTPEINEADYHDFSGYFFAALTGVDRVGRQVHVADYRHDGHVGMDEAFDYALINDESIDTPVCTSDAFLRRFIPAKDEEVSQTRYADLRSWARPGQLAALDAISQKVGLSGEKRFEQAYDRFRSLNVDSEELNDVYLIRFVRLAKSVTLQHRLDTGADEALKTRFHDLLALEGTNPLSSPVDAG